MYSAARTGIMNITRHMFCKSLASSSSATENLRSQVLRCFKDLHRTRCKVFEGDAVTLQAGRNKINEEFKSKKDVSDPEEIQQLIVVGTDATKYLKSMVVQAELGDNTNVLNVKITKDTAMYDNVPFGENVIIKDSRKRKKKD